MHPPTAPSQPADPDEEKVMRPIGLSRSNSSKEDFSRMANDVDKTSPFRGGEDVDVELNAD